MYPHLLLIAIHFFGRNLRDIMKKSENILSLDEEPLDITKGWNKCILHNYAYFGVFIRQLLI